MENEPSDKFVYLLTGQHLIICCINCLLCEVLILLSFKGPPLSEIDAMFTWGPKQKDNIAPLCYSPFYKKPSVLKDGHYVSVFVQQISAKH